MKKFLTLFVFGVVVSFVVNAQYTETKNITPLGFTGSFTELKYGNGVGLIALNGDGVLYTSRDTGRTWEPQLSPLEKAQEIVMYNESLGYIYNENQMYRTIDGCATWQELTMEGLPKVLENQKITYNKLTLKNEDTLFLAVSNKINGLKLYMSGDKGNTWKMVAKDIMNNWIGGVFFALHFDTPLVGYGYCYGCQIYTEDGGETWTNTKYSNFEDSYLIAVKSKRGGVLLHHLNYDTGQSELLWCENGAMKETEKLYSKIGGTKISELVYLQQFSDTLIMVDDHWLVYKSYDNGKNWDIDSLDYLKWKINSAYFYNSQIGVVVGANLTSYVTTDGGDTWTKYIHGGGEGFNKIYCKNENECFITGQMGRLFSTKNGGSTWEIQTVHDETLYEIEFPTNEVGYIVGHQVIFKTIDGGNTWDKKNTKMALSEYIDFINPEIGYMGYSNSMPTISKTTNGGDKWKYVFDDVYDKYKIGNYYPFSFKDENEGAVCGKNVVLYTFDGGTSWRVIFEMPEHTQLRNILSLGDNGWLLYSGNTTANYNYDKFFLCDCEFNCQEVFSGTNSSYSGELQKINDTTYRFTYDTLDYITTDEGLTWNPVYTGLKGSKYLVDAHHGYSIYGGQIYKATFGIEELQVSVTKRADRSYELLPQFNGETIPVAIYLKDSAGNLTTIVDNIEITNETSITIDIPDDIVSGMYSIYIESQNSQYMSVETERIEITKKTPVGMIKENVDYRINGKTIYVISNDIQLYTITGEEISILNGVITLKSGVYILVNGNETYKIVIR